MTIKIIQIGQQEVAHILSDQVLIDSPQDALDLMGETQAEFLILHTHNFSTDFFDLSSKKLGDALQKFTNYRVKVAVIGDFSQYPSPVLPDFIRESNRHGWYVFVDSLEQVKKIWENFPKTSH